MIRFDQLEGLTRRRSDTASTTGGALNEKVAADALGDVVLVERKCGHRLQAPTLRGGQAQMLGLDQTPVTTVATNLAALILGLIRSHTTAFGFGTTGETHGMSEAQAVTGTDATENKIFKVASVIATDAASRHAMAGTVFGLLTRHGYRR
jgi:hypothetical protein